MGIKSTMFEYLKLFRLQTGATTAVAPIIGYLIISYQQQLKIEFYELFVLFIIGVLMHIFEFVLNEYIDLEVDKRSPDLAEKPLVSGTIAPQASLVVVFTSLILSYILLIIFFFDIGFWSMILLSLSFGFGAIYDIHGKRFAGSDFTLALWIFLFCLFGASIQSIEFTGVLYLVAGLGFFQILFNNAIEGGLKDADHDAAAGAKTLAHTLGARVQDGKLIIPNTFKFSSYSIKLGHISLIILLIYVGAFRIRELYDIIQLILIIILIFIIFYTLQRFLSLKDFRRDKLKRIFSIHEIATYYLAPIILLQIIGIFAVLFLLLLPLFWYMGLNLILYGRPLEPRV
jgi:4-hydroxybenzoate polyprenyltransferase